jgi:uncharacterized protein YciI
VKTLFAVLRARGPAWDPATPMRAQPQWSEHAAFMDNLADDGWIVLGGPVGEEEEEFLFAVKARDEEEIRARLARDPWSQAQMLQIRSIHRWTILLESANR